MRRQQRLATAGGDAQAHAWHLAERLWVVAVAGLAFEGRAGALKPGRAQVALERVERLLLIGLEGEGGHPVSGLASSPGGVSDA